MCLKSKGRRPRLATLSSFTNVIAWALAVQVLALLTAVMLRQVGET